MICTWYFKIVSNFTRLTAREITYNNFEISLVVFMPNITTNHAISYTKLVNGTCISRKRFQREKRTTFSKFHLFPGILHRNARNTCVLLTSQPEFLGKLKAPLVTWLFLNTSYTDTKQTWGDHHHDSSCGLWEWRLTDSRFHGGSK